MPKADGSSPKGTSNGRASRTRTGCLTCRTRRVKCDQGKPSCDRCERYGAECRYAPRVTLDQVVKRANKGKDARSRSSSKQPDDDHNEGPAVASGSVLSKVDLEWQFVLEAVHYMDRSGEEDPWEDHVLPIMQDDRLPRLFEDALVNGLLALGAMRKAIDEGARKGQREELERQSSVYRHEAIKAMRRAISAEIVQQDGLDELRWESFLATGIAIMGADSIGMHLGWREPWQMLVGATRNRVKQQGGSFPQSALGEYLVGVFAVLDCFASIAVGCRPVVGVLCPVTQRASRLGSLPIDLPLLLILIESASHLANKIRLDDEHGPADLTQYEVMPIKDALGEHALFGSSPARQERRRVGLAFKDTHRRMIEWKQDEGRLDRLEKRMRERSLAMWNACWLYYLTEAYLEDTEKPEIRETAVDLLLFCEQAEDDDRWMGWPLVLSASILSDAQCRVRALAVLGKRYHPKLNALVKDIWERFDTTTDKSLVRATRELGQVVLWP